MNIKAADLYRNDKLNQFRDKLAGNYGHTIVRAFNQRTSLKSMEGDHSVLIKNLGEYSKGKKGVTADIGSTHIRVTDPDGETEDFVLSLRRYTKGSANMEAKSANRDNLLEAKTTYLAYSPDRFYLQDDENGDEMWPVTFPAVSLDNPDDKITLTFNKDGFVSSSLSDKATGATTSANNEPDIVFAEATPVIQPNNIAPCDADCEGGGGGGGGGDDISTCTQISGRGGDTGGETDGSQTYFMVNTIRLWATGDGDDEAELQMFIRNDDDYEDNCFPRSYKYRFDTWYDGLGTNTITTGADGQEYGVADVNHEDIDYNIYGTGFAGNKFPGFPLFDFTNKPGPWRIVMSDDDKDYHDFSRRRADHFAEDIQTYDMVTGTWSKVNTGFSVDRKTYGSGDDPIKESGVRRITYNNALNQLGGMIVLYSTFRAEKYYPGGSFAYEFSMKTY